MQQKFDIIVVGAGLGGLCAAYEAAAAGKNTLLLEQHNLPGGYASSFVRGRFEFEPSLHELPDMPSIEAATGVVQYLRHRVHLDVDFVPIPEAYRLILTGKALNVRVPFGIEEFIETVETHAPGSREAVRAYMELCTEVQETFHYLNSHKDDLNYLDFIRSHPAFIGVGAATMDDVAQKLDLPEAARDIMYPYWCYLGVPSRRMSFPIWASLLYSYISAGATIPKLRSHELSAAFVEKIRLAGGQVWLNARVAEITAKDGTVTGVRLADGTEISADAVISNASPSVVFSNLIAPPDEVPAAALQNIRSRKHGFSLVVVYLGLDASPDELGLHDYSYFIAPHMETDRLYDAIYDLESDEIMQATVCLNAANPGCSPEGTTILAITAGYRAEAWASVKEEDYFRVKNRVAERLITQFEKATGVDLRNHIEEIEIATPQTFARYSGAWEGIVYGYEPEPWDSVVPRAVAVESETYLNGLDFCGGFSYRSHGYGSSLLSGKAAVERILKRQGGAR